MFKAAVSKVACLKQVYNEIKKSDKRIKGVDFKRIARIAFKAHVQNLLMCLLHA